MVENHAMWGNSTHAKGLELAMAIERAIYGPLLFPFQVKFIKLYNIREMYMAT